MIGRYILQPDVFHHLSALERGSGNEVQLTDAMAKLITDQAFHGLAFEGQRYDCGDKVGYLAANIAFALDREDIKDDLQNYLNSLN